MDEGGWYFPPSYEHWIQNGTIPSSTKGSLMGLELEMESSKLSEELLVSGPLEHDESTTIPVQDTKQPSPPIMTSPMIVPDKQEKKPRKKRRNFYEASFDEKYDLTTEVLGRGAHSLVTLAVEKETQKQFAVKVIEKYEGYDRGNVLREIDLLHFLADCPNVLHLYDCHEETNEFYLVFERMKGGPLLSHLQTRNNFTEKQASLVVHNIAVALKFLHDKGISHRDLKPDNILCVEKDSINPVVICDFNLASGISMIGSATTPDLYTPVGSAEFMAPEVVDAFVGDAPAYDKRCDLWSLGVILYIMLSGKPPFTGNCKNDCDWEKGGSCRQCQSLLWHNILDANYDYSEEDGWGDISMEAKDLVSHLLVKEASKRYTVEDVLCHPWFQMASNNVLATPEVLTRESNNNHLSNFTSEAVAYRRIISERQSSQEQQPDGVTLRWSTPPKFGLSPPGKSRLAKRRSLKQGLKFGSQSSITESPRTPSPSSPVKLSSSSSPEYDLRCASMDANWSNARNITPIQSPIIEQCAVPERRDTHERARSSKWSPTPTH
jgi:MAP kinase interacting serine/threonine kinase